MIRLCYFNDLYRARESSLVLLSYIQESCCKLLASRKWRLLMAPARCCTDTIGYSQKESQPRSRACLHMRKEISHSEFLSKSRHIGAMEWVE